MQGPAEKKLERAMKEYFDGAAKRYAKRIKEQQSNKSYEPGVTRILDYNALMAIYDEFIILWGWLRGTDGRPGAWKFTWDKSGKQSLERLLRMANIPVPDNIVWGQNSFLDYQLKQTVTRIVDTTGKQVGERVQQGLLDGMPLEDIAMSISEYKEHDKTFGYGRALTIARTESTNAITGAQLRSFEVAKEDFGIRMKKAWIANRDDHTRDEHIKLERLYGRDDQAIDTTEDFKVDGYSAAGPGKFGAPEMDINCRCAVVPVIIKRK